MNTQATYSANKLIQWNSFESRAVHLNDASVSKSVL